MTKAVRAFLRVIAWWAGISIGLATITVFQLLRYSSVAKPSPGDTVTLVLVTAIEAFTFGLPFACLIAGASSISIERSPIRSQLLFGIFATGVTYFIMLILTPHSNEPLPSFLRNVQPNADQLRFRFHARLAYPLAPFLMTAIGVVIGLFTATRSKALRTLITILVAILVSALYIAARRLVGPLPPEAAAWVPTVAATLIVGLFLIGRSRFRGDTQST